MFFDHDHLSGFGDRPALVTADGFVISYARLAEDVQRLRDRMDQGRGLLLLPAPPATQTIIAFLAGLQAGNPVFPLAPDHPAEENRLRTVFPFRYRHDPRDGTLQVMDTAPVLIHPDLAVLLSTSGSTGAAKSIRLSRTNIQSNAEAIADYLGLGADDRAPTNLPLYYSYGMSVVTSHLQVGASLFVTPLTLLDSAFWDGFDRMGCTSFAAVPHVLDMLEKSPFRTADRPSLRYVTQAGGKLAPDRVAALARRSAAEGWHFFVMYGQTEASPRMAYLPPDQAATHPDCIGGPIPGGAFTLEDEDGRPVTAPGGTGELVYRGPNVMMGYATGPSDLARGPELDRLRTGDLATRDADGLYRITGRKSRFIKPFGLRISLDEVDAWLSARGLRAISGAGRGERLWVLIASDADPAALRREMADWLGVPVTAIRTAPIAAVPLGPNGKTDGRAVAAMISALEAAEAPDGGSAAAEPDPSQRDGQQGRRHENGHRDWGDRLFARMGAAWDRIRPGPAGRLPGAGGGSVMEVFRSHFPDARITPDSSFAELGGDSLRYLGVALDLERVLGHLPDDWGRMRLRDLEVSTASSGPTTIETATFLRCLSIIFVISGHLHFMAYGGGGAMLLFTIAGFSFAMYQIPTILASGSVRTLLSQALRVAVPAILYASFLMIVFSHFDWRIAALISNWISPNMDNNAGIWFIAVYVQILLAVALIFLLPPVRRIFAARPYAASVGFVILSIATFRIAHEFWDTHYLYRRVPHMTMWLFALGMAAHHADTTGRRIIVTGLGLLGIMLFNDNPERLLAAFLKWYTLGFLLLVWLPRIEVPSWSAGTIRRIAGASLFIYLTHFQWAGLSERLLGDLPAIQVVTALAGGVLMWLAYERLTKWMSRQWRHGPGNVENPAL